MGQFEKENNLTFDANLFIVAKPDRNMVQHINKGCPEGRNMEIKKTIN